MEKLLLFLTPLLGLAWGTGWHYPGEWDEEELGGTGPSSDGYLQEGSDYYLAESGDFYLAE